MRKQVMLRVRMSETLFAKIEAYAESKGLTTAEGVRCWAAGLDGEGTPGELAELDKLITRLQARRDTLRPKKATATAGEGEETA